MNQMATMSGSPKDADANSAIYRGAWYSLARAPEAGYWQYTICFEGRDVIGRIEARLSLLAVRHIKLRIDRELQGTTARSKMPIP